MRFAIPLTLFVLLVILLGVGLTLDPRHIPSPLINQPAPEFTLQSLAAAERVLSNDDFTGRVFLLNVWASWCAACRTEHPLLVDLGRQGVVELIGLNYKDKRSAAREWLRERGDPYAVSLFDPAGSLGLDLGVYGVPETFVIDTAGVIRYKHVGPITRKVLQHQIMPLVDSLRAGSI